MLRAIIFDVDGTLAETEEVHRATFNRAFAEAGLDWHWDQPLYGRLLRVAGGKERVAHYAAEMGVALDSAAIARLHARKTALYVAAMADRQAQLRPGVAALIAEARAAGVALAIATTTTRANIESLLASTLGPDATSWFTAIVAGDEVAAKKPAPDVYLAVLNALALPASACIAIEDSPDGLSSARAAGIRTLITPSHYMADGDFTGAWRVVPDLTALGGELLAALGSADDQPGVEMPGGVAQPR